jgi:glycosyltransferase involved in cell wall biosynthesis
LKILFVTGNYLPGKKGGIENYTHWLARILLKNECMVQVAALNLNEKRDYLFEGVRVNYVKESMNVFEELLKREQYDICHFHEYSEHGIEVQWFKKAKEHCKRVFFTFHLPYLTCYKNDLRYKGLNDCNTFNSPARCAECTIYEKSMDAVGNLFAPIATSLATIAGLNKKLEKKVILKHHCLRELITTCDEVFIIADWFKKLLNENGYSDPKIKRIPNRPAIDISTNVIADNRLIKNKIVFVGRIEHQKGLHLLCEAMNQLNQKNLELDVYGNKVDEIYFDKCLSKFSFNYKSVIPSEVLKVQFKNYDFLVLPSVFTEMYPLVIIDAFHSELPVIASTAKGNRDAVCDGENGFLFDYNDAADLASTIDKAYHLEKNGWRPVFKYSDRPEKDIEEIISYYLNKSVIEK